MEPNTSNLPVTSTVQDTSVQTERLLVASRLATDLAGAHSVAEVAGVAVRLLHESFAYYLAVVQRLDPDGYLRVVSGAGPLAEEFTDGLAGDRIPRGAMIVATCDAFHAMTSNRSYRRAISHDEAIDELEANAGTQFDPLVVAALVAELSFGPPS